MRIVSFCAVCGKPGPAANSVADFEKKTKEAGWRLALVRTGHKPEQRWECPECQVFLGDPDENQPCR